MTEATKQKTRGDERRQDLILAAYQIIAEKGFEGLRVRDVAAHVGVNIATLHYYFHTKEDLIRGVVDHLLELFLTIQAPVPEGEGENTPGKELRGLFADLQYQFQQEPQMFVVLNELHVRAPHDEAIRDILKTLNNGWGAHIESICREGIDQHVFRPDLDPQRTASVLIALIKGISMQVAGGLDTFNFDLIGADFEHWLSITRE